MQVKPRLKLAFSDFWHGLDPQNNFFTNLFRRRFSVEISQPPDLLVCSVFGQRWTEFEGKKLFFTGENIPPEERFFDYSMSFEPRSAHNYYLPLYRLYGDYPSAFRERRLDRSTWESKRTAAAVFSNRASGFRNWTYEQLHRDFGADSGGKAFNTVGGPVADKAAFLSGYRFSMAFENTRWSGYTTEKLVEAYASGTVPLYWGDPTVSQVFNPQAFVALSGKADYPRVREVLRRGQEDFSFYRSLFEAPLFPNNQEPEFLREDSIADFLENVVASPRNPLTRRATSFAVHRWQTWWGYRVWDERQRPLIGFLQSFAWVGWWGLTLKKFLKKLLGR